MDPLELKFRFDTANDDQIDDNVTELPELTNATGTTLQNLHEDCLLEIFSSDSLTLMDLCSVAETCIRFKEITQRLFTKGFEIKSREVLLPSKERSRSCISGGSESPVRYHRMENRFDFESQHRRHCNYDLWEVERIFKSFGQNLRKLELLKKPSHWHDDSVYTLAGHEANLNVDMSSILSYNVSSDLNSVFQPPLELSFRRCDLLKHSGFNGDSLTQLNIMDCINCDAVLQHTFPSLKQFAWENFDYDDKRKRRNIVFDFINRHGHLEAITFSDTTIGNYVIDVINSSCKKLEELTIHSVEQRNSSRFSKLESLAKTLKVFDLDLEYENSDQYIPVFQAMKSLEEIRLRCMCAEDVALVPLFKVLSQLQNLRKLQLESCPFDRIPWLMLTGLTELHLSGSGDFPNVVKQLINLEKFECRPNRDRSDIKRPIRIDNLFLK